MQARAARQQRRTSSPPIPLPTDQIASSTPAAAAAPSSRLKAGMPTSRMPIPTPAGSDVKTSVRTPGDASAPSRPFASRALERDLRGSAAAR